MSQKKVIKMYREKQNSVQGVVETLKFIAVFVLVFSGI